MKKGIAKCTAFALTAGLMIWEGSSVLYAAGTDTVLVGLGSAAVSAEEQPETVSSGNVPAQSAFGGAQVLKGAVAAPAEETEEAEAVEEETAEQADESTDDAAMQEDADAAPENEEAEISEEEPAQEMEETEADDLSDPAEDAAEEDTEEAAAPVEETEKETEEVLDKSMVGTTGFAQCEEYLNVRSDAGIDGEVVGKVYNNGSVQILDVAPGGWYHVRSGNVEGYVSKDYVAIGEEASQIAAEHSYTTAQVDTEILNVRSSATTDSDVIATIDNNNEIEVVEDQGDWIKVILDGEMYGYISSDYVSTTTEYATGETLEEEQERLDREWLAYLAEQEAARAAAEAAYLAAIAQQQAQATVADTSGYAAQDTTYTEPAPQPEYTPQTVDSTADIDAQCSTAYQNYLDAQEAADAAVANGEDEQTIISTASDAQAAYATYLEYQDQADAAAAGITQDASAQTYTAEETTAETTEDYSQTVEDYSQTTEDYSQTTEDYSQTTEDYTQTYEEPQVEETASSSGYSTGEAIANYACQFVGNPYVYGGSSLTNGADCSGFTMSVMANFGIGLPHNAAAQSGCGTPVSLDSLQPGDLLFYEGGGGIGHVSIYIGNGQVVHASNPTNGILISGIGYRTPCAARRFV